MDSLTRDMKVTIHLSDVDCNESFPDRILSLVYPDFCVTIGRGSQNDENIEPAPENAWFSSRVMSRQHALLRADPYDQILTIQDDASMHGTFLNGHRVGKERLDVIPGDILTFGTEVVRGEDTYQPLKVSIHYDWQDEEQVKETTTETTTKTDKDTSVSTSTSFRNKFTVDFSEDDSDSDFDDDIQFVGESAREPSVEILCQIDAFKTQPQQPTNCTARPLPVSALVTTTGVPDEAAANKINTTYESFNAVSAEVDDDSDAENNQSSPYYSDDEDESEVDSDIFNGESDFAEDVRKEDGCIAGTTKVVSVLQPLQVSAARPVPASCVPTVPVDNTEREPSPSDAALARPRLAAPSVPPAPKPTSGVPVPQPSSTYVSDLDPCHGTSWLDKSGQDRMYPPSFYPQAGSTSRPSHSFVNPYSYNSLGSSICSMGAMNSYASNTSTYPWDLWKNTYATNQVPRPITRFGPPNPNSSTHAFPNATMLATVDQPSRSITCSLSPDNLRGKKRKADEASDFSDDESIESTPETSPSKTGPFECSSPAPSSFSKVTANAHTSTKVVETSNIERASSLEVEEALEQADAFMKELQERVDQAQNKTTKGQQNFNEERRDEGISHTENVAGSDSQAESEDAGRLRKKRKLNPTEGVVRQSRIATTLKFTATALAGATVGVLGTVIGLASLPTDYFV